MKTKLTPREAAASASEESLRAARERLDAWVREVIQWHFSPETGCPFWLERAARLGWDPREGGVWNSLNFRKPSSRSAGVPIS